MSDHWDEEGYTRQALAAARNRIERLVTPLTRSGLNDVSLRVALAVEDLFAQDHRGGRTQRLAKVQILIRSAIEMATQGEADWNAWHPNSCGPAPEKPMTGNDG